MARLLEPDTTIAVILGAHDWTKAGQPKAPSFRRSAAHFHTYLLGNPPHGLGLEPELILYLFDDPSPAVTQLMRIGDTISSLVRERRDTQRPIRDVLIYYVGHGTCEAGRHLHLLVRDSLYGYEEESSIGTSDLATVLRKSAPQQRRIAIFDCCFAGAAANAFMGTLDEAVAAVALKDLAPDSSTPERGTLLFCSCPPHRISIGIPDAERTLFTGALLSVLKDGSPERSSQLLTFDDLREDVFDRMLLSYSDTPPRPALHQPDQQSGDLTRIPAFPNAAYGKAAAEQERLEKVRLENEARAAEQERLEKVRLENEARAAEQERLEKVRLENEARAAEEERLEKVRLENEARTAEEERLEKVRLELFGTLEQQQFGEIRLKDSAANERDNSEELRFENKVEHAYLEAALEDELRANAPKPTRKAEPSLIRDGDFWRFVLILSGFAICGWFIWRHLDFSNTSTLSSHNSKIHGSKGTPTSPERASGSKADNSPNLPRQWTAGLEQVRRLPVGPAPYTAHTHIAGFLQGNEVLTIDSDLKHNSNVGNVLRWWNPKTAELLNNSTLPANIVEGTLALNTEINLVAIADQVGTVHRYRASTGDEQPSIKLLQSPPDRVVFFPDGLKLALTYRNPVGGVSAVKTAGELDIIDTTSQKLLRSIPLPNHLDRALLAIRSDGHELAVGIDDHLVIIDPDNGQQRMFQIGNVQGLEYAPNGHVMLLTIHNAKIIGKGSGRLTDRIEIWDPATGGIIRTLGEFPPEILKVNAKFVPDESAVLVAGKRGIQTLDASTGNVMDNFGDDREYKEIIVDGSGEFVAARDKESRIVILQPKVKPKVPSSQRSSPGCKQLGVSCS